MAPMAVSPEKTPRQSPDHVADLKKQQNGTKIEPPLEHSNQLNDGHSIPQIALGVYKAPNGQETIEAVTAALDAGYRHIDSAARYANEEACGRAINAWLARTGVPREQLFVTSKLWDADHGYESTWKALLASLDKFGLDYLDLYLIHSPADSDEKRYDSWRAMEDMKKAGKVRSIGVSNFGESHIQHILEKGDVRPAVNQIEVHPFCPREDLVELCQRNGILIEAYSPLARGNKLEDERIMRMAEKYGKTPAQVLLNWNAVHKGNVVLPKSLTPGRIRSNTESFDFVLDEEDVRELNGLGDEQYVTGSLHKSN